jgi:dihydroorotase
MAFFEGTQVASEVWEARRRGVLFDCAHGSGNFTFATARVACAAGFCPDTMSSDLSLRNWHGPAFDLATTTSKLLYLGLDLTAVVRATTPTPS